MEKFCQSCSMPLTKEVLGTEKDGSPSEKYCVYCYKDGEFVQEMSMEEMMEFSIGPMVENEPGMTEEVAKNMLEKFFPTLERWK